jgi:hypothetical protein
MWMPSIAVQLMRGYGTTAFGSKQPFMLKQAIRARAW